VDEEKQAAAAAAAAAASEEGGEHLHVLHTHATHGHAHGSAALVAAVGGSEDEKDTVRHRVISQVGNNLLGSDDSSHLHLSIGSLLLVVQYYMGM
jgi:hypothetical protein